MISPHSFCGSKMVIESFLTWFKWPKPKLNIRIHLWWKSNYPKIILENESNKPATTMKVTKIQWRKRHNIHRMINIQYWLYWGSTTIYHVPVAHSFRRRKGPTVKTEWFQIRKLELMLRKSVNSKASVLVIYYMIIFIFGRVRLLMVFNSPVEL